MVQNMTENGRRFVAAYNQIDHGLRVQYNFKANVAFSDLIRRCASLNTVIKTYEDDLIDLARLRNAIVHSKSENLIAEPNSEVVVLIEKIARLVTTPPLAIEVIKSKDVIRVEHTLTIKGLIAEMSRVGYSSLPIYRGKMLIGVIRWQKFVEVLGTHVLSKGLSVDQFIERTTVEELLGKFSCNQHYLVASPKITIEEVIGTFNFNRKIACIIITADGTTSCPPLGIITGADIIDLMQVLEDF